MNAATGGRWRWYDVTKRAMDLALSTICLIVLSPALLIIAAIIRLTSAGPVFYAGLRVGLHGRTFRMLKFRTMHVDAERFGTTTAFADPRVTRFGRILRHAKLDELPQLINVVRGEMSLVGPRPEVIEHTDAYSIEEREILSVKPGITDFSSIHFSSLSELLGSENAHEVFLSKYRATKNELRLKYVRERSLVTDSKIVLRTVWIIFRKIIPRRGKRVTL